MYGALSYGSRTMNKTCSNAMTRPRLAALSLLAVLLLLTASPALAKPLDVASDRVALNAYHTYVSSLVAGLSAADRRAKTFAATVRSRCAGVLTPLESPATQVSNAAIVAFGEEIGGDVTIQLHAQAVTAFSLLSGTLGSLTWSSPATGRTVSALVSAMSASLVVGPSALCVDARALLSHPLSEPAGTLRFLDTYQPAAAAARQRLTPFLAVLERFQTASEASTIDSVDLLVTRYSAVSTNDQAAVSATIVKILGLPTG